MSPDSVDSRGRSADSCFDIGTIGLREAFGS